MRNPNFSSDVNFLEGIDYTELKKFGRFATGTIATDTIDANATETLSASESDNLVSSVNIKPESAELPKVARLIGAKVNISQGSSDSRVAVFQSGDFNEIDQVISISSLTQSSTPETYILGSGIGTPFINKEDENQVHFKIEENSGADSTYEIELYWANIPM